MSNTSGCINYKGEMQKRSAISEIQMIIFCMGKYHGNAPPSPKLNREGANAESFHCVGYVCKGFNCDEVAREG